MSERMKAGLVCDALKSAYWRRKPAAGLVMHTDRGSQYASDSHQKLIDDYQMIQSMSRRANCWDNAAMESFFALLQKNVLDQQAWRTREQLRIAIITWIERTYHRRRQAALGRLTPVEYETIMTTPAIQAA